VSAILEPLEPWGVGLVLFVSCLFWGDVLVGDVESSRWHCVG
jgi:hypothetical protein